MSLDRHRKVDDAEKHHQNASIQEVQKKGYHIATVMDGNRRFARNAGISDSFGHKAGSDVMSSAILWALQEEVRYASFWALSKENIERRNPMELAALYTILRTKMPKFVKECQENRIDFGTIGDLSLLPKPIANLIEKSIRATEIVAPRMTVIMALGYSGQDEIIRGVRRCIETGVDPKSLNEEIFRTYLDSGRYPSPDLIIRTGEDTPLMHHSGFYLWDSQKIPYYFLEKTWPEFTQADLQQALEYLRQSKQRLGA